MRIFKKVIYFVSILVLLIVVYIIYDGYYSPSARLGKRNLSNARSLKIGMSEDDVVKIMGKPNSVDYSDTANQIYKYRSNNVDYLDIEVFLDKKKKVSRIFLPEK